jgi:hypothetical protein
MYRIIIGSTSEERMRQIKSLLGAGCSGRKSIVQIAKAESLIMLLAASSMYPTLLIEEVDR